MAGFPTPRWNGRSSGSNSGSFPTPSWNPKPKPEPQITPEEANIILSGLLMKDSVYDGDTFSYFDKDGNRTKVRAYGIDAPEIAQNWGPESRDALWNMIQTQKNLRLTPHGRRDMYGRVIGTLYGDNDFNLNREQVARGNAWNYAKYNTLFPEYAALEAAARLKKLGLWQEENPVPPWEFRRQQKG